MRILITGGAGYIGSHIAVEALVKGYKVTVFDDLSTGSEKNIPKGVAFIQGSTLSKQDLSNLIEDQKYDAVIHLAASKAAGESMENPYKYAENNIFGGINLINTCVNHGIKNFIFSSTAAVYGNPRYLPIDENHISDPGNFYGYTKLVIENNLRWFSKLKNLKFISLRYFNAAGYDLNRKAISIEKNPQNLIPIVMETACSLREKVFVYGNDYSTKDGTGIRDYIHVSDLASAHLKAIHYLKDNNKNLILNLGTGEGHSVLDVIKRTEVISGNNIKYEFQKRRKGDPDSVVADAKKAFSFLNWEPKSSDLDTIIKSTWGMYSRLENVDRNG